MAQVKPLLILYCDPASSRISGKAPMVQEGVAIPGVVIRQLRPRTRNSTSFYMRRLYPVTGR